MNNELSALEKFKFFETSLKKLDVLDQYKFSLISSNHVSSKEDIGECFEYLFSSNRGVSIEFTLYPAFNTKSDYVVVSIIDEKTSKDFSLDSWLQAKGTLNQMSPFNLSTYKGNFENRTIEFLKFISASFTNPELIQVLRGEVWVDVEFAWGDIK